MVNFSDNSLRVLKSRYQINGETPQELFERVAIHIGISDILHDDRIFIKKRVVGYSPMYYMNEFFDDEVKIGQYKLNEYHMEAFTNLYNELVMNSHMTITKSSLLQMISDGLFDKYQENIKEYYDLMVNQLFMPNTPTLMNAGASLGQLSACFVLDIPDNMEGIMDTCKDAAIIFKSGGGVGINYSSLREQGAEVKSTKGVASGPVSFMEIVNSITNVIKQGGKRRGANMGILDIGHPDINKFIENKKESGVLENFNISVAMWDKPENYDNLDLIAESAHACAEPGIIFFDNMNKHNPLLKVRGKPINTTNPCVVGNTKILTDKGYFEIRDVVDKEINIWNGAQFSKVTPRKTAKDQPLITIQFSDGNEITCTPYHKFILKNNERVEGRCLKLGDKLQKHGYPVIEIDDSIQEDLHMQGFFSGDGWCNAEKNSYYIGLYGGKKKLVSHFTYKTIHEYDIPDDSTDIHKTRIYLRLGRMRDKLFVPDVKFNIKSRLSWLAGICDSDGAVSNDINSKGISITSRKRGFLKDIQSLLHTLGVRNSVDYGYQYYDGGVMYRLVISANNVKKLQDIGFKTHRLDLSDNNPQRDAQRFISVQTIKCEEISDDVYCFNEPINHSGIFNGLLTSNCGEQGLYANESCNLGSINVSRLFENGQFNWKKYGETIRVCTRFLDNVVDVNKYPTNSIDIASKETRRIGLGVMGVADLLFKMDIKYDSPRGLDIMEKLAESLTFHSLDESVEISKSRGSYYLYNGDYEFPDGCYESNSMEWVILADKIHNIGLRNVLTTTIAPTGTISMIADCSNGMEPVFALSYKKTVSLGSFDYINPILQNRLEEEGYNWNSSIENLPQNIKDVFVTAMDINWKDHVKAQAVWQKWIGNSISKTINMPNDSTINDVKEAYKLAHKLGCKGITVYRDGSRSEQVLYKTEVKN